MSESKKQAPRWNGRTYAELTNMERDALYRDDPELFGAMRTFPEDPPGHEPLPSPPDITFPVLTDEDLARSEIEGGTRWRDQADVDANLARPFDAYHPSSAAAWAEALFADVKRLRREAAMEAGTARAFVAETKRLQAELDYRLSGLAPWDAPTRADIRLAITDLGPVRADMRNVSEYVSDVSWKGMPSTCPFCQGPLALEGRRVPASPWHGILRTLVVTTVCCGKRVSPSKEAEQAVELPRLADLAVDIEAEVTKRLREKYERYWVVQRWSGAIWVERDGPYDARGIADASLAHHRVLDPDGKFRLVEHLVSECSEGDQ